MARPLKIIAKRLLFNSAVESAYWFFRICHVLWRERSKNIHIGRGVKLEDVKMGKNVCLFDQAEVFHANIADFSYVGKRSRISNTDIGKFCSIAPDVRIGGGGRHPTDWISTHPAFYSSGQAEVASLVEETCFEEKPRKTRIGHDVWICAHSVILDGVQIGHGAVVAAGSVVVKDVEPYVIIGGVPAKPIKYRFEKAAREALLRLNWWDQSEDWLRQHAALFKNPEKFLNALKH